MDVSFLWRPKAWTWSGPVIKWTWSGPVIPLRFFESTCLTGTSWGVCIAGGTGLSCRHTWQEGPWPKKFSIRSDLLP